MLRRLLSLAACAALPLPAVAAQPGVTFNRDVRPILSDACFACHGPDSSKRKAKLRLDTAEGARGAFVPGDPAKSEAFRRITSDDADQRMPPAHTGRALSTAQIGIVKTWIEQGAKFEKHWAFLAPHRPAVPEVKDAKGVHNPIDAFVRARLQRERIGPALEAGRATLLRRVSLDLTGLPPTPDEVDAFVNDKGTDAYEKVVDRLLASPRYGERMALDWLDLARYADSNGYQSDRTRTMWPWRDWVIDAFNRNMPYDQFTIEQLAGDLLPDATRQQKVASGFHRNHMLNGEGGRIAEESRVDYVIDRVDTTAAVWMGLTLGCARCHDHKFDPFSQKDYYQLFAYFNNVPETGAVDKGGNAAPVLRLTTPEEEAKIAKLTAQVKELQAKAKVKSTPTDAQRVAVAGLFPLPPVAAVALRLPEGAFVAERLPVLKKLANARKELDAANKAVVEVMVMEEQPTPRDTRILIRGAYDRPGEKVTAGTPAALPPLPKDAPPNRLALAKWLVNPEHPLTARVAVNRAWQTFFGAGLMRTPEDYGVQGEVPMHPELLDWLATEFVRTGWDVKGLHKLIVMSATYRQSSRVTAQLRERDPDNKLVARGPRHRLSSMLLRDQALAAGGLLVEKVGGRPVKPYQPPGIWEEMTFGQIKYEQDKGESLYRRSLYTFWRRTVPPTMLFDTASRQVCAVKPARTNTPLHALTLLNDVTYVEAARGLATRALNRSGSDNERLAWAFKVTACREPSDAERKVLARSLERLRKQYTADKDAALKLVSVGESPRDLKLDVAELAAWTGIGSLLLNLDEVLCKE